MPQDVLKQIDQNKNQEILLDEIKKFSRTSENINILKNELQKYSINIKKTLETNLYNAQKDLLNKKVLTDDEQLILNLYEKIVENKITNKPNLTRLDLNIDTEFNNMINRVKASYPDEYKKLLENQTKKYAQKTEGERSEYIKYDIISLSIGKYQEELQIENNMLLQKNWFYEKVEGIRDPKIWSEDTWEIYWWWEYFACSEYFTWMIENQYPEYIKDQTMIRWYNTEVSDILKKNGYRNSNDFQKDSQLYKEYIQKRDNLSKDYKYEESLTYLAEHEYPENDSEEKIKEYFSYVELTLQYGNSYDTLLQKYDKKIIWKYEQTMKEINKIQTKYTWFLPAMQRLSTYMEKLEQKKSDLLITDSSLSRYTTYIQEVQNSWIQIRSQRVSLLANKLANEIQWKSNESFIFPNVKQILVKQKEKQLQTDKIWNFMKIIPEGYFLANILVWAWNGIVDATIWVGTWLGILAMTSYKDENQLSAQSDRAEKRNNFLKIGQSTIQKEPPVKEGKWNLNFDNGTAHLWSSVTNMLVLLSGAGAIAKWTTIWGLKLWLNISQQLATKWWLFTWVTMQWLPNSFQSWLQQWLDEKTAWNYAIIQTLVSSSLEMIAPNDMFFENISKLALKQLGKEQWAKAIANAFVKNISKEMGEEVTQESLQFAAERLINKITNDSIGTQFETSITWADFGTTAVLTALTTGIVSGKWSLNTATLTVNNLKIKQWIVSDQSRYIDYKVKLNQIIDGKLDIWISIEQAQIILNDLETANLSINQNSWNNLEAVNINQKVDSENITSQLESILTPELLKIYQNEPNAHPSELFGEQIGLSISQNYKHIPSMNSQKLEILMAEKYRKANPLVSNEFLGQVLKEYIKLNPELATINDKEYPDATKDILHGVASKFSVDDIKYYVEYFNNYTEKQKEFIGEELYSFSRKFRIPGFGYIPSPKTLWKIEEFLVRSRSQHNDWPKTEEINQNESINSNNLPDLKNIPIELLSKAKKDNLKHSYEIPQLEPEVSSEFLEKYNLYQKRLIDKSSTEIKENMEATPDIVNFQKKIINKLFDIAESNVQEFRYITNVLATISGGKKPDDIEKYEIKNREDKGIDRILNKINFDEKWDFNALTDFLRTTIIFNTIDEMNVGIEKMLQSDYLKKWKVSIKNRINSNYAIDMIMKFELPSWFVVETQLHTLESHTAKHEWIEVNTNYIDMGNNQYESITTEDRILFSQIKKDGKIDNKFELPFMWEKRSTTNIYDIRRELELYKEDNIHIAKLNEKLNKLEIQINQHYIYKYQERTGIEHKY